MKNDDWKGKVKELLDLVQTCVGNNPAGWDSPVGIAFALYFSGDEEETNGDWKRKHEELLALVHTCVGNDFAGWDCPLGIAFAPYFPEDEE